MGITSHGFKLVYENQKWTKQTICYHSKKKTQNLGLQKACNRAFDWSEEESELEAMSAVAVKMSRRGCVSKSSSKENIAVEKGMNNKQVIDVRWAICNPSTVGGSQILIFRVILKAITNVNFEWCTLPKLAIACRIGVGNMKIATLRTYIILT